MSQSPNLLSIISVLWRWRKRIFIVTAIAIIGSIILALLLPNYYKATTTFYPASEDFTKPTTIRGMNYFGQDKDIDRLFSILGSYELMDSIISKYDLYRRYDIDMDSPRAKNSVRKEFQNLCKWKKTKYDAVEISVEDIDRDTAALIANSVRDVLDGISWRIIRSSQKKILDSYESTFADRDSQLKTLSDSLTQLKKKYEIFIIGPQGQSLVEARSEVEYKYEMANAKVEIMGSNSSFRDSIDYWKAQKMGLGRQLSRLNKSLGNYNEGFSQVVTMESLKREFSNQLTVDKERYKQLQASYSNKFSSLHVMEEAEAPVIKSRPKRSLYVIGAAMFAFILSVLAVLMIESYRKVEWKKVLND